MAISQLRRLNLKTRKIVIIVAAVVTVLSLVAYAFWSMNTWNTYKTTYENWQKDLKVSVDAVIASPSDNATKRTDKLTALKDISASIEAAQHSLCRTPGLVAWQRAISALRGREEACNKIAAQAKAFGEKVRAATSFLDDEHALADIIDKAFIASKDKVTEATWGSQVAIWQDASRAIEKLPSKDAAVVSVKAMAIEKMKSIETAWQELVAAHAAKDKAKYVQAQANLAAAYEALPSLAVTSNDQMIKLADSLQTAYTQTFSP